MRKFLLATLAILAMWIPIRSEAVGLQFSSTCNPFSQSWSFLICTPPLWFDLPQFYGGFQPQFPNIWTVYYGDLQKLMEYDDVEFLPKRRFVIKTNSSRVSFVREKDNVTTYLNFDMPPGYAKYFVYYGSTQMGQSTSQTIWNVPFWPNGKVRTYIFYWCPSNVAVPTSSCGSRNVVLGTNTPDRIMYVSDTVGYAIGSYYACNPSNGYFDAVRSLSANTCFNIANTWSGYADSATPKYWSSWGGTLFWHQKEKFPRSVPFFVANGSLQPNGNNEPPNVVHKSEIGSIWAEYVCATYVNTKFIGSGTDKLKAAGGMAFEMVWLAITAGIMERDHGSSAAQQYVLDVTEFMPEPERTKMRDQMNGVRDWVKSAPPGLENQDIADYVEILVEAVPDNDSAIVSPHYDPDWDLPGIEWWLFCGDEDHEEGHTSGGGGQA